MLRFDGSILRAPARLLCIAMAVPASTGCPGDSPETPGPTTGEPSTGMASTTDGCGIGALHCTCGVGDTCDPGLVCIDGRCEPEPDPSTTGIGGSGSGTTEAVDTTQGITGSSSGTTGDDTSGSESSGGLEGCLPPSDESFDPDGMFVEATLSPGAAGVDLFCDVTQPNSPSVGFPWPWGPGAPASDVRNAYVRPTDCRLLFLAEGAIYEFRADAFVGNAYPMDPLANDVIVPTDACSPVTLFVMDPLTGDIVYTCGTQWYDGAGAAFEGCPSGLLSSIDELGTRFCGGAVVDALGTEHLITGVSAFELFIVRSKPGGGFWGATYDDVADRFSRWSIDATGVATPDGTYAALPAGLSLVNANVPGWGNIDRLGNFYRWATPGSGTDVIVRFSADFTTAEVVLDESLDPTCKLHGFNFITTP